MVEEKCLYGFGEKTCKKEATWKTWLGWECKGKGKVHPIAGREGPEGEERYSSTLSLTLVIDGLGWNVTPRALYPRERPGTYDIGVWVGPGVDLDECENLTPNGI